MSNNSKVRNGVPFGSNNCMQTDAATCNVWVLEAQKMFDLAWAFHQRLHALLTYSHALLDLWWKKCWLNLKWPKNTFRIISTYTRRKNFYETLFQAEMDLQKVHKQGRDEKNSRTLAYYGTMTEKKDKKTTLDSLHYTARCRVVFLPSFCSIAL